MLDTHSKGKEEHYAKETGDGVPTVFPVHVSFLLANVEPRHFAKKNGKGHLVLLKYLCRCSLLSACSNQVLWETCKGHLPYRNKTLLSLNETFL